MARDESRISLSNIQKTLGDVASTWYLMGMVFTSSKDGLQLLEFIMCR